MKMRTFAVKRACIVAIIILLITLGQQLAFADPHVLFQDSFGNNAASWTAVGGNWTAASGVYEQSDAGAGIAAESYAGEASWTDYIYEADVKITGGHRDAAMAFRVQSGLNNYYVLSIRSNSWLNGASDKRLELMKFHRGVWKVSANAEKSILDQTFYHIKIEVKRNQIKVFFNHEASPSIDYTDTDPIRSGKIGFRTWQTSAMFDNVVVTEIPKDPSDRQTIAMTGASIKVDPSWPYYAGRSYDSIAEEIELAGYRTVHYIVVNEYDVKGGLIDALHNRGIAVWLVVFGNGTYSAWGFPPGWENWKMGLINPSGVAGFTFFSMFNQDYVQWKKTSLARIVTDYPFDGIEIMEAFFPEWNGLQTGVYGDVGPDAQAAFAAKYNSAIPDFVNSGSPNYYLNNSALYQKWIEFRVNGVNDFLNEIYNGQGGVRQARPDILVATWSLAIDGGPDSVAKLRELQGNDAGAMAAKVNPDIHFFQTHWPDWSKPESQLPPGYMQAYQPFVDRLRSSQPHLPVGLQADNGSLRTMIKSASWQQQYNIEAAQHGYATWTTYEYHIGGYMYADKPQPKRAVRLDNGSVMISFNKRIDETTAKTAGNYTFWQGNVQQSVALSNITVDGNRVVLESGQFPAGSFEVAVSNIKDTPSLWLFTEFPANTVVAGSRVNVQ
ncbi:family 16 glycoside hydrolase [Paenibacillus sp. GCM10027626]|uniref:family 16 glycoside hydrolase n=1 Tax=Paenibacillus sp. GCM10027626 TaxID=3273411 RepID=UPI003630E3F8